MVVCVSGMYGKRISQLLALSHKKEVRYKLCTALAGSQEATAVLLKLTSLIVKHCLLQSYVCSSLCFICWHGHHWF